MWAEQMTIFDHNVQFEITMYNSLENHIIKWSGDYKINLSLSKWAAT